MKTFTKAFETSITKMFFEDFTTNTNKNYYIFAAKATPYDEGSALPTIGKGVTASFYNIQDQIIFGKRLTASDISYMVKKNIWATDTVYDIYDDQDDTLYEKNFFVFTEEGDQYSLFKCLNNNFGALSVDQPLRSRTSFDDELYQTGDGYIWKLMTTISSTEFAKFETETYAPLEHETIVSNYAVPGSIDVILVESEGSQYNSFAYGSIKSTAYNDDPRRFTIQTDTERDIYEISVAQTGDYPITNTNAYFWTFPIGTSESAVFTTIATADYSDPGTLAAELLGTTYATNPSIVQVARDLNFNLSYADLLGGENFFLVTSVIKYGYSQAFVDALLIPSNPLFQVDILGRKLGDIDNNGTVGASDALQLEKYFNGTNTSPTQIVYIENVMIPFMYANAGTYAALLPPLSFGLITGLQIILVPELSANNNFYTNSAFYIRGGTGAGQLKTITDYSIIGNDRIITVDEEFSTTLDSTSKYEIAPKVVITGDGTGAMAVTKSTLPGGSSNSDHGIRIVEVVNRGTGYSYADITLAANTGLIDTDGNAIAPNAASVRAVIPPSGGHGADIINETYATQIGISADFINTEHTVDNDYHIYGIMLDPIFRNIEIVVSDASSLTVGDLITQDTSGAKGYIAVKSVNTLTLERVEGVWVTSVGSTFNIIKETGNIEVTTVNGDTTKFDNRTQLSVTTTVLGQEFEADEFVTQETSGATGYVHFHDTDNDILYLTGTKGSFVSGVGYAVTGATSGVIASINSVTESDIYADSGEILYIETVEPITRGSSQTERVKIVTKF